jgi:flagellar biosynthesis/type III secretory pathway protein FliH
MLAKVIKEPSAANFAPFFGAVGAKNPNDEGVSAFSFPELNDQDYSEGIISEDFITPSIEDVLQAGHQEHEQIVSQTKAHSAMAEESIRNQALQEARQMLEAENAAQIAQLRGQLTDTIAQISSLSDEIIQRVENDVVELALEIAKKIVAREVMFDREIALTLVKVSLKKLHSRAVAEVRLHP